MQSTSFVTQGARRTSSWSQSLSVSRGRRSPSPSLLACHSCVRGFREQWAFNATCYITRPVLLQPQNLDIVKKNVLNRRSHVNDAVRETYPLQLMLETARLWVSASSLHGHAAPE